MKTEFQKRYRSTFNGATTKTHNCHCQPPPPPPPEKKTEIGENRNLPTGYEEEARMVKPIRDGEEISGRNTVEIDYGASIMSPPISVTSGEVCK